MIKTTARPFLFGFIMMLPLSTISTDNPIISVNAHHEVAQYVNSTSTVIYDIDETLTYRESMFFHPQARNYKKRVTRRLANNSANFRETVISTIHQNTPMRLMEENLPVLIASFIAQGAQVFACTRRYHGSFGVITSFEEHTYKLLQKLAIEFSFANNTSYEKPLKIELNPLECAGVRSCKSLLYNNIFFTDDNPKGAALIALFVSLGFIPEHVVFVDDLYENLVSVSTVFARWGIPVVCIHYKRAQPLLAFSKKELIQLVKNAVVAV